MQIEVMLMDNVKKLGKLVPRIDIDEHGKILHDPVAVATAARPFVKR